MNRRYIGVICSFKALRSPAHFRSSVMRPIRKRPVTFTGRLPLSDGSRVRRGGVMGHRVVKQSQRPMQPFFASPLPSEASTLAGSYEMAPNLLLDLVSEIRERATRVAEREVVNPAANYRLNRFNQPFYRLRARAPDNLFKTRESFTVLSHLVGTKQFRP